MFSQHHNAGGGDSAPRRAHPEGEIYDPHGFKRVEATRRWTNATAMILVTMFLAMIFAGMTKDFDLLFFLGVPAVLLLLLSIAIRIHYDSLLRSHERTVALEKDRRAHELADRLSTTSAQVSATKRIVSRQKDSKSMVNNVTLNFSNGSSFVGSLAVGENIKSSYDAARNTSDEKFRDSLEALVMIVTKLVESLKDDKIRADTAAQLKAFVEESKKPAPSKWMLGVTSQGLIDAASTVAKLANPVSTAVKAVLNLLV